MIQPGDGVVDGRHRSSGRFVVSLIAGAVFFATLFCIVFVGEARSTPLLNQAFGQHGKILDNIALNQVARDGHIVSLDVLPGGKTLVAVELDPDYTNVKIIRFNADGTLDKTLSGDGIFEPSTGYLVKGLPNGRFLVGGSMGRGTPGQDIAVTRYRANAKVDRSFAKKGAFRKDLGAMDSIRGMVFTSDGRLVLMANSLCHAAERACYDSTSDHDVLLSLSGDGKLLKQSQLQEYTSVTGLLAADNGNLRGWYQNENDGFSGRTYVQIDRDLRQKVIREFTEDPGFQGLAMLPNDSFYALTGPAYQTFSLVRYSAQAVLDPQFGAGGSSSCIGSDTGGYGGNGSVQIDSAGRALVQAPNPGCFLFRVLPDGTKDPSFGIGGAVTLSGEEAYENWTVQAGSDGKIILARWEGRPGKLIVRRLNENGQVDQGFAKGQDARLALKQPSSDVATAVVSDSDGGTIIAGKSDCSGFNGGESLDCIRFAMTRRKADGSLDRQFGKKGVVSSNAVAVQDMARLPDGDLVVAGTDGPARTFAGKFYAGFALARYTAQGEPVKGFGDDGVVSTRISKPADSKATAEAFAVASQRDGKIVATGDTNRSGESEYLPVVRYNRDGSLDPSFGDGGIARIDLTDLELGSAIKVLKNGRILIAGRDKFHPIVIRLMPDGRIDRSFGRKGVAAPKIEDRPRYDRKTSYTVERWASSMAVLSDGSILAGTTDNHGGQAGTVFKLKKNGRPDHRFGQKGVAYIGGLSPEAVSVDRCGRVVVSGNYWKFSHTRRSFGVTRLLPNGALDRSFRRGRGVFPVGKSAKSQARASTVVRNGNVIVVGAKEQTSTGNDFAIVAVASRKKCN